jgi:Domain of unknown function (DUF4336)
MRHLPLQEFGPEIWVADGPVVPFYGFPYPTRMVVIRLSDGGLFVWSPIVLSPALRREIDRLEPVRHLVSPNRLHHLFLKEWKAAYPHARLYASPGLRRKRRDLAFDVELGDMPEPDWAADIDQVVMRGSFAMTEVVFFHRASCTVLFADLIENLPRDWFQGWRGFVARLGGIVAPNPNAVQLRAHDTRYGGYLLLAHTACCIYASYLNRIAPNPGAPREWRASFLGRRVARTALDRILAWPIERVLIAHGEPVTVNGAAFVRRAFAWLRRRERVS